jgi:DNA-binding XRE family transcriptional regulator
MYDPVWSESTGAASKKSITQHQLAKALGVSSPYLSALEQGKRGHPSWALAQKIITYFGAIWGNAKEIGELARY